QATAVIDRPASSPSLNHLSPNTYHPITYHPISNVFLFLVQPHRIDEARVAGRVPRRKPHPRLPRRVERNGELLAAERRQVGGRNDLTIGLLAVAPHHFDKLEREGPIDVGVDRPLVTAALD